MDVTVVEQNQNSEKKVCDKGKLSMISIYKTSLTGLASNIFIFSLPGLQKS